MEPGFDRAAEDASNIIVLEHVNVEVPAQEPATDFYVTGLGLTRDPYLMSGTGTMWVNVGRSQFHLPKGDPLVLRGHTGLVVPSLDDLVRRLAKVKKQLDGSRFSFSEHNEYVEAMCPWGNRIRLYAPDEKRFGAINLGMPYVEFDVPLGTAERIARFYIEIMGAPSRVSGNGEGKAAHVDAGPSQELIFRETDARPAEYDGHHLAIYVHDFSGPHRRLEERGLVSEESDRCQYRFENIVDLDTGKVLFKIEHEVRSLTHPLYARPLVNRNPAMDNTTYAAGAEAWNWQIPRSVARPPGMAAPKLPQDATEVARRRVRDMYGS